MSYKAGIDSGVGSEVTRGGGARDMFVLQQPVLPRTDMQQPLLHMGVPVLQQRMMPLDLCVLEQPVLSLDFSDRQQPVLPLGP